MVSYYSYHIFFPPPDHAAYFLPNLLRDNSLGQISKKPQFKTLLKRVGVRTDASFFLPYSHTKPLDENIK